MKTKFVYVLILAIITAFSGGEVNAFTGNLSDSVEYSLKAEFNYSMRMRTEDPDPDLITTLTPLAAGDTVFEKNDLVNNKAMMKFEAEAYVNRFALFMRGDVFYDHVYSDESLYDDYTSIDYDEIKDHASLSANLLEYYLEGNFSKLTFRLGNQVVQWGELLAPINAITVNTVSPYDMSKVTAAGYTARDYQVPSMMARLSLELTNTLSFEAVYNPEFKPRDAMPVVGTINSYTDYIGYGSGSPAGLDIIDDRPDDFEDKQQYGGRVKKLLPGLQNLELGLYYYHHLYNGPRPIITADLSDPTNLTFTVNYEEIDMYGLSMSYCFDAIGFQVGSEVAYRPNDVLPKAYIVETAMEEIIVNAIAASMDQPSVSIGDRLQDMVGGYDTGKTLNWGISGSKIFSDVLRFTPYTFSLTFLSEIYGSMNLDYDDAEAYYDPEHRVYYTVQLPLSVSDMIDNTLVTFELQASGGLHKEEDSVHKISGTVKAKYGDHMEFLVGYDVLTGQSDHSVLSDRDAVTCMFTWFFL